MNSLYSASERYEKLWMTGPGAVNRAEVCALFSRKLTVEPADDGGWVVLEGTDRLQHFARKRDATIAGRDYLRARGGGELLIRSLSGRLTERDRVPG